jgi:DUF1680 family protein
LIEAALAHHQLYGNQALLGPVLRYVDLLIKTFGKGPDQIRGYSGHPEIELALLRLYSLSRDVRHLQLARYFIDERGNSDGPEGLHYFDFEARNRGEREGELPKYYPPTTPYQ